MPPLGPIDLTNTDSESDDQPTLLLTRQTIGSPHRHGLPAPVLPSRPALTHAHAQPSSGQRYSTQHRQHTRSPPKPPHSSAPSTTSLGHVAARKEVPRPASASLQGQPSLTQPQPRPKPRIPAVNSTSSSATRPTPAPRPPQALKPTRATEPTQAPRLPQAPDPQDPGPSQASRPTQASSRPTQAPRPPQALESTRAPRQPQASGPPQAPRSSQVPGLTQAPRPTPALRPAPAPAPTQAPAPAKVLRPAVAPVPAPTLPTLAPDPSPNTSAIPANVNTGTRKPVSSNPLAPLEEQPTYTVSQIQDRLEGFVEQLVHDHNTLVQYCLDDTVSHLSSSSTRQSATSHFALLEIDEVDNEDEDSTAMKVKLNKFEVQGRGKSTKHSYQPLRLKTNKKAVPFYRFHHIDIEKCILSPNAPLKFVPHVRDLKQAEEQRYNKWLQELHEMDRNAGFSALNQDENSNSILRDESTATVALYLERWLELLGIRGCTRQDLIKTIRMSETPDGHLYMTNASAENSLKFIEAFDKVFNSWDITLKDVLARLKRKAQPKEGLMSQTSFQEDPASHPLINSVSAWLNSYTFTTCIVCYRHSCEHGTYEELGAGNNDQGSVNSSGSQDGRSTDFSRTPLSFHVYGLENMLKDMAAVVDPFKRTCNSPRCSNMCFKHSGKDTTSSYSTREWKNGERMVLRCLFLVLMVATQEKHFLPECLMAVILDRYCWEVHDEIERLGLERPPDLRRPALQDAESGKVRHRSWYDRDKKVLLGDWEKHAKAYEPSKYTSRDPCIHEGPCTVANGCICAKDNVFCERFCRCTTKSCALKFTGCACHSSGKTCLERQRQGRPCICRLLNRECDPLLCIGCGARERADPHNKYDQALHATGCQNCALQRGAAVPLLLGESSVCGYGAFTAVDIAAGEFVCEYVGDMVDHDEGTRREARRGDPFDDENTISYLFTLLEDEGIWVDGEIYGNLSRYINHAPAKECNVVPRVVRTNSVEFRIRFTAQRNIKAGEELFFDYGRCFPNLTKRRLELPDVGLGNMDSDYDEPRRFAGKGKNSAAAQPNPKTLAKSKRGGPRPGAGRKTNSFKQAAAAAANANERIINKGAASAPTRRARGAAHREEDEAVTTVQRRLGRKEAPYSPPTADDVEEQEEEGDDDYDPGDVGEVRNSVEVRSSVDEGDEAISDIVSAVRKRKRGHDESDSGDDDDYDVSSNSNSGSGAPERVMTRVRGRLDGSETGAGRLRRRVRRRIAEIGDSEDDDEEEDENDADEDAVDRASRRRQRPARYRDATD